MRRFPIVLLLWSSSACPNPADDKGDPADGGDDDDDIDGAYVVRLVDNSGCASVPAPRRRALMTSFVYPDTFQYGNERRTERGLLLLGGESTAGTPLDDLWLYDLSRPWDCPWFRLDEDATTWNGVADGALVFTRDDGAFTVVGGRGDSGDGWFPLDVTLKLASLQSAFSSRGASGVTTAAHVLATGDPLCADTIAVECYCTTMTCGPLQLGDRVATWMLGTGTNASQVRAVCEQSWQEPWGANTPDIVCVDEDFANGCETDCDIPDGYLTDCRIRDPYCFGADVVAGVATAEFDEAIAGRHSAGVAWNPITEQLVMYGGTIGCTDGACDDTPFPELLDWSFGGWVDETVHEVNAEDLVVAGFDQDDDLQILDRIVPPEPWRNPPPPDDVTVGVREAAAAFLGLSWNQGNKSWSGVPDLVVWGGTFHQSRIPWRENVASIYPHDDGNVTYWGNPLLDGDYDAGLFIVDEPSGLRRIDLGSGAVTGIATALPPTYDGAMVAIDADHLVTLGGNMGPGVNGDVRVVSGSGAVVHAQGLIQTTGAVGAFDPVGGSAWFVGEFGAGGTVVEVRGPDAPVYVEDSDFVVEHLEGRLTTHDPAGVDPVNEGWWADLAMVFTVDCGDAGPEFHGCYTHDLTVHLSSTIDTNSPYFNMHLVQPPADETAGQVPLTEFDVGVAPDGSKLLTVHSPVALVEPATGLPPKYGLIVKTEMNANKEPTLAVDEVLEPTWVQFGMAGECTAPAWMMTVRGWWARLVSTRTTFGTRFVEQQQAGPFGGLKVGVPDGYTAVGAGWDPECANTTMRLLQPPNPATETCFDLTNANDAEIAEEFTLDIRGSTEHAATFPSADVWVDTCLGDDLSDVVDTWLSGTGDVTYDGAQEFLLDRIGAGSSTRPGAIWIGRSQVGTLTQGLTIGPNVRLHPFGATGLRDSDTSLEEALHQLDAVGTHEFAHLVLNARLYDPEVHWLQEALPSLIEYERRPGVNTQVLFGGLYHRVNAFVHDDELTLAPLRDLSIEEATDEVSFHQRYETGPYLLAQLAGAVVGNDSVAFWNAVRDDLQSKPFLAPYTQDQARALIETELGLAGQYDARVRGTTFGEPLLGISSYDLGGGALAEVTIEQVQTHLVSDGGQAFSTFARVPYALGCVTNDARSRSARPPTRGGSGHTGS